MSAILRWREPKDLKKKVQKEIPLKRKVVVNLVGVVLVSLTFMLVWLIAYLNPNKNVLPLNKMVLVALGGGIAIQLLNWGVSRLHFDEIQFQDNILFFVTKGIVHRFKYATIKDFTFEELSLEGKTYRFLAFKVEGNKRERAYRIEMKPEITESQIRRVFADKGVYSTDQD